MEIENVDESNFEEKVMKSKLPVVIDMWAEWCGPCRIYSPILEEVAKEYENKAKFFKINTDENPNLAEKFGIMSIPTTLLIKDGKVKAVQIGAVPKDMVKKWLDKNLK